MPSATATVPILGIGASAGGLEAFQVLVATMADSHRLALVLIQHLDPDHESLLPELLAKRTSVPVQTITDGVEVEQGRIYLIPPGASLSIRDGRLKLASFDEPRGQRRPIDRFFESLADDQAANCCAVVLSGTGSDGAVGVRAIKEAGGLVFVQEPGTARYDGMPNSAIATNAVDLVLPTEDMVGVAADYFDRRSGIEPTLENDDQFVARVAKHLRYRTGHDFSQYKQPTFLRRIARRMSVLDLASPSDYVQRLVTDRDEAGQLFRDLLINVTNFFRDPPAFESLRRTVIPKLVANKGPADEVRVWVPGCSTGQEPFSIAMLIAEELSRTDDRPTVSIFATDIDEEALRYARNAVYPGSIVDEIPAELLDRYFTSNAQGFRPSAQLRDMVRFFRRSNLEPRRLKLPRLPSSPAANGLLQQESASKTRESPETLYQQAILARHSPPYVVVGREREIVYSSGRISRFLELAPGTPRLDIVNLAKPALERPLKRLLMMEPSAAEPVCHAAVEGEIDGRKQPLLLSMERLKNGQRLIVFQDRLDPLRREDGSMPGGLSPAIDETYVRTLEDELEAAKQTIRTTVEELETSNEELKSSNEEMMSMNEELQSANEELSTVNEELQNNVAEQNLLNTDLTNLIESTEIATIFLEENLTVRSYTPAALRFFRLVEHDRGRPLVDIASDIDTDRLIAATARMLRSEEVQEDEQQTRDGGEALLIRILPYRTGEGTARGAVLTFTPVTELRRYARELEWAEGLARQQLNEIEEFYRMSPQAMALVDRDLRYIRVNQRMAELGDLSVDNFLGRRVGEIEPALVPQVADPIRQVFETGQPILGDELTGALSADPEMRRTWEIDRYPIYSDGAISAVGMVVRDVSKHKQMEAELRRVMRELQHRVKNMLANVTALINRARRESGDPAVALERLVERVRALANTHNLLTAHNWSTARFIDILGPELVEVYGATRVSLKGPEILLNARAAVALSMAIHELATNAAKYGALSDPQGRLDLTWARTDEGDGEQLVIRWQEHGGPETRPPEAEGFGSQLIASTISGSLGGRIEKSFDPSGFRCVIEIPTARVIGDDDDDPSGPLET